MSKLAGIPEPTIYLVRHGQTSLNKDGKIRGWMDTPLDSHGVKSAQSAAEFFDDIPVDCIYSSDLERAEETANIIAKKTGSEVEPTEKLRPWNLGEFQGQEIEKAIPKLKYYEENPDKAPTDGEPFNRFFARWKKFLSKELNSTEDENIIIVCHVRHLLTLRKVLDSLDGEKVDLSDVPVSGGPGPGAIVRLRSGKIKVVRPGDAKSKGGS